MIVRRNLDMWRCAIVTCPTADITASDLTTEKLIWLPPAGRFSFRADPFGLWHDGLLHIFVERFDYRSLKGRIELLVYDGAFNLLRTELVLSQPWHLSYPYVFEGDGAIWMLPEARRSGELTLYRAAQFPSRWQPAATLDGLGDALDATPFRHGGHWWLIYGRAAHGSKSSTELRLAFADRLTGPWRQHPRNPVRSGLRHSRPGGTPLSRGADGIELPVQDCSRTYGGGIRRLTITRLDEREIEASDAPWLEPAEALAPTNEGLHTVSEAGPITLIDCKLIDRSLTTALARAGGKSVRRFRKALQGRAD